MKTVYIYALQDPVTGKFRYIGKSIRPVERLQNHMNEISNCHRSHWLQALKQQGLRPLLHILEEIVEGDPWQSAERYWIAKGICLGWPLTNNTVGGDGVEGLPPETREKMRQAWLGRKHKPETLIKLSKASKGRRKTESQKKFMSEKMMSREITWGAKISEALRKISPEQIEIIRARLKQGEMVKDLADEYGVHRTTLSKIKMGTYRN